MIRQRLPALPLGRDGGPALALGRAHEIAGPSRRAFAAMAAGALTGPVLWVRGPWREERLNPEGLQPFFNPARLVEVSAPCAIEALWAAEEGLRSGAAPLVVLEPAAPPALTPVRRLQLAAEAGGAAAGGRAPLCLILTPESGAAAAVETRWRVDPAPGWAAGGAGAAAGGGGAGAAAGPWSGEGPACWLLRLLRDKAGPPGAWRAAARRPPAPPRFDPCAA